MRYAKFIARLKNYRVGLVILVYRTESNEKLMNKRTK